MKDPAQMGHCLACGAPCYAQSHCDRCADDDREPVEECCKCKAPIHKGDYAVRVIGGFVDEDCDITDEHPDSLGIYCKTCGENIKTLTIIYV